MAARAERDALRILVAEDEAVEALGLKMFLAECGHTVVAVVDSAEAAVNAALAHHPDLVIMDICLRGTYEGIQAALTIWIRWEIPTIFITGYPETREQAQQAQPLGYFVKPVIPEHLRDALKTAAAWRMSRRARP